MMNPSVQSPTVTSPFKKVYGVVPISKAVGDKNVRGMTFSIADPTNNLFSKNVEAIVKDKIVKL